MTLPLVIPGYDRESRKSWIPDQVGDDAGVPGLSYSLKGGWLARHVDPRASTLKNIVKKSIRTKLTGQFISKSQPAPDHPRQRRPPIHLLVADAEC